MYFGVSLVLMLLGAVVSQLFISESFTVIIDWSASLIGIVIGLLAGVYVSIVLFRYRKFSRLKQRARFLINELVQLHHAWPNEEKDQGFDLTCRSKLADISQQFKNVSNELVLCGFCHGSDKNTSRDLEESYYGLYTYAQVHHFHNTQYNRYSPIDIIGRKLLSDLQIRCPAEEWATEFAYPEIDQLRPIWRRLLLPFSISMPLSFPTDDQFYVRNTSTIYQRYLED